jgi:hypothetical protein
MKIINFDSFLDFADEMTTKYKFYRTINGNIQCFMIGRDVGGNTLILHSEVVADTKVINDITSRGFKKTELSKEEIESM